MYTLGFPFARFVCKDCVIIFRFST